MSCRRTLRSLPLYVGGDLPEARAREVERHVADCESCAAELRAYERSRQSLFALKGEPRGPAPDVWPALRLRIGATPRPARRRAWRVAAALALVAAGAAAIAFVASRPERPVPPRDVPAIADRPLVPPRSSAVGEGEFVLAEVVPVADDADVAGARHWEPDALPSVVPAGPERTAWDEF